MALSAVSSASPSLLLEVDDAIGCTKKKNSINIAKINTLPTS